jgi:hypothetical protein
MMMMMMLPTKFPDWKPHVRELLGLEPDTEITRNLLDTYEITRPLL